MTEVIGALGRGHEVQEDGFSVVEYLRARAEQLDFAMVEFGHDTLPVAHLQPFAFTGQRLYVGLETWLRDDGCYKHESLLARKVEYAKDGNIFFLHHDVGSEVRRDEEGTWITGEYDPATALPTELADEVLLSNVFGDPHISCHSKKVGALLAEAARITKPGGCVVIREAITPTHSDHTLTEALIKDLGLVKSAVVKFADQTSEWAELEKLYKAEPIDLYPYPQSSFYYFLQKQTPDDESL